MVGPVAAALTAATLLFTAHPTPVPQGQLSARVAFTGDSMAPAPSRSAALAIRAQPQPPRLDGRSDDAVWALAPTFGDFVQKDPNEGQPASERTEVRILYTRETLYFGVVCYDRQPQRLVVNESRRDSSLDDTDSFQIVLDT